MLSDPRKEIDSCVNLSLGVRRRGEVEGKPAKYYLKTLVQMLLKLLSVETHWDKF